MPSSSEHFRVCSVRSTAGGVRHHTDGFKHGKRGQHAVYTGGVEGEARLHPGFQVVPSVVLNAHARGKEAFAKHRSLRIARRNLHPPFSPVALRYWKERCAETQAVFVIQLSILWDYPPFLHL